MRRLGSRVLDFIQPSRVAEREAEAERLEQIDSSLRAANAKEYLDYLAQTVTVTDVVGANGIEFTDARGEQTYETITFTGNNRQSYENMRLLSDLFLNSGTGRHTVSRLGGLIGRSRRNISEAAGALADFMPRSLFRFAESYILIGNIAIASRQATADEKETYEERERAEQAAAAEKARRAAEEADDRQRELLSAGKEELITYDHAFVATGRGRKFYLPLDTPRAVVGARVLEGLGTSRIVGGEIELDQLIDSVWRAMPPPERELFTDEQTALYGRSAHIRPDVLETLRKLTVHMGITREVFKERFTRDTSVALELRDAPLGEGDRQNVVPIFPPGTPREKIRSFSGDVIPPITLDTARTILDGLSTHQAGLPHQDAIELLDFITSREGKRALRREIEASGQKLLLGSVLEQLHKLVRMSLGEGYLSARRARTIAGNSPTGDGSHIQQVGGELPKTTKWHIGIKNTGY